VLGQPIIREELDNIIKDFIPLTKEFTTAPSAHKLLEQIVDIQCELSHTTDYGLAMIDES
jgi:hypothetical protein